MIDVGNGCSRKRRSAAARQAATRGQSKAQTQNAWWKQPVVWIGGLVTALAAAAAAAFGTGLGTSLFSAAHNTTGGAATAAVTGPPVLIDSVARDPDQPSFSYVLPQRLILSKVQLQSLNRLSPNDPAYNAWFTSRGGVQPEPVVLKLIVEGNRPHPVLVIDIHGNKGHLREPAQWHIFLQWLQRWYGGKPCRGV